MAQYNKIQYNAMHKFVRVLDRYVVLNAMKTTFHRPGLKRNWITLTSARGRLEKLFTENAFRTRIKSDTQYYKVKTTRLGLELELEFGEKHIKLNPKCLNFCFNCKVRNFLQTKVENIIHVSGLSPRAITRSTCYG